MSELKIETLLNLAIEKNASDLLLTAGAPPILRIHGELVPTDFGILTPGDTARLINSMLSIEQQEKVKLKKELDFSLGFHQENRFRVNVYYQRGSLSCAIRAIPSRIPSFAELGLPKVIASLALRHQGLILITGPTGHGKTTTLAAIIDYINNHRRCHVIAIEDPIEYVHHHKKSIVDQREVNTDTESFAGALKYVLRQDPDVILIGEMRDLETISAALTAAETGHLVLATLHTNNAPQSIDRIIDVFPPHQQPQVRTQLAATLLAVVAQQLLIRADKKGRVLAVEIMINTPAIGSLIRENKTHQLHSQMETSMRDGMITMDRALKELYLQEKISFETALLHARVPAEIERLRTNESNTAEIRTIR
ncbi:MAG: type IV pilus twitching motility protein PilT [bacterium]|nr:type IV pilus twitching motility protein PilT [bacterium]